MSKLSNSACASTWEAFESTRPGRSWGWRPRTVARPIEHLASLHVGDDDGRAAFLPDQWAVYASYSPSVTSAHRSTTSPLRKSITADSCSTAWLSATAAVATIMSHRSWNATATADLGAAPPPAPPSA